MTTKYCTFRQPPFTNESLEVAFPRLFAGLDCSFQILRNQSEEDSRQVGRWTIEGIAEADALEIVSEALQPYAYRLRDEKWLITNKIPYEV